jgi:hypothetical protein
MMNLPIAVLGRGSRLFFTRIGVIEGHRQTGAAGGFAMSKDFVQIADDVISGVKLLREGAPEPMKGHCQSKLA